MHSLRGLFQDQSIYHPAMDLKASSVVAAHRKSVVEVEPTTHAIEVFTADDLTFDRRFKETLDQNPHTPTPLSCRREAKQIQLVECTVVAPPQKVGAKAAHDADRK